MIEKDDRDRDRLAISPRSPTATHITDRADAHQSAETKAQFAIRGGDPQEPYDAIWLCLRTGAHLRRTKTLEKTGRDAAGSPVAGAPEPSRH